MYQLDPAIEHLAASRDLIQRYIQTASSVAEKTRRRYVLLHVLDSLGLAYYVKTSYEQAIACLEELLNYARFLGGTPRAVFFSARAQVRLAQIYNYIGEPAKAMEQAQAGRQAFDKIGLRWGLAFAQNELGRIHFAQGAYDQARSYYQDSLEIARELSDREISVNCHLVLGEIAIVHPDPAGRRDLEGATRHLEAARRILEGRPEQQRPHEEPPEPARLPPPLEGFLEACRLWIRGIEEQQRGHRTEAAACFQEAEDILQRFGFDDDVALLRQTGSEIGVELPQPEEASPPA